MSSEQNPDLSRDQTGQSLVPIQRPETEADQATFVDTRPYYTDLAGLDNEIARLKEFNIIRSNVELAEQWGVTVPTGLLLCGPGGVGKTELVRAFSRDIEAELMEIAVSDVQSMWVGKSNENLRDVFNNAQSYEGEVVLFFDELDGLFSTNAGGNDGVAKALISEFKTILSQLHVTHPNTTVAASTNSLSGFDEALLRPGRFDLVLQMGKPDDAARVSIFGNMIFSRLALYNLGEVGEEPRAGRTIDLTSLAAATEGMTGADIKAILQAARTKRLMAHLQRGEMLTPISQDDILLSIRQHRQQRPNATN